MTNIRIGNGSLQHKQTGKHTTRKIGLSSLPHPIFCLQKVDFVIFHAVFGHIGQNLDNEWSSENSISTGSTNFNLGEAILRLSKNLN